jgi:hemoglobin-like flavoprotein
LLARALIGTSLFIIFPLRRSGEVMGAAQTRCCQADTDKATEAVDPPEAAPEPADVMVKSEPVLAEPAPVAPPEPLITVDLNDPPVDVNAPLEDRDIELVQQTFAKVAKLGAENVGWVLFMNIFEIAPGAVQLFPFKDEPDISKSSTMKAHAGRVVGTVATAVSLLRDLDTLVPVLQELGLRHVGYGVIPAHYDIVGQALIKSLTTALGPQMTPAVTNAYLKVFTIVKTTMIGDNYKDVAQEEQAKQAPDSTAPKEEIKDAVAPSSDPAPAKKKTAKSKAKSSDKAKTKAPAKAEGTKIVANVEETGPLPGNDSSKIVSAAGDVALVWDAKTGEQKFKLEHAGLVNHACFGPDGARILTCSADKTARIWDAETGKELLKIKLENFGTRGSWDAAGKRIATCVGKKVQLWQVSDGNKLASFKADDSTYFASFDSTGKRIVIASEDSFARVFSPSGGKEKLKVKHDGAVFSCSFHQTGKTLLTSSGDSSAKIWDAENGKELAKMSHQGLVFFACFNPAGDKVLTTSADRTAVIWDASTAAKLVSVESSGQQIWYGGFDSSGNRFLTGAKDKACRVWDSASGKEILNLAHDGAIKSVHFSSN